MTSAPEAAGLLQVVVLHSRDVAAATHGGADRLLLTRTPDGAAPEPAAVSAALRETDLPLRVVLDGVTPHDLRLAEEFLELGAEGVAVGPLDHDLAIDRETCLEVAGRLRAPWTFVGFDRTLNTERAWEQVRSLPWLDAVATAGSSRGLAHGADALIARATQDRGLARLVLAAGGLQAEHVPWLVRSGVRQFGVGSSVRPDRSWAKAYVDAGFVRSWRMLLDDAVARAHGVEPG